MKPDVTIKPGDADKPAVIFIHGMGMDKRIWESPYDSRILGGKFPLTLLLNRHPGAAPPRSLTTLFHVFGDHGYTVVAWSQQRPSAEIEIAALELSSLIEGYKNYCKSGIVLVGHSRGGLIARKYLLHGDKKIKGLITLSSPHGGSRMAQWAKYLTPLISIINPLLSGSERGTSAYAIKKVFDVLKSDAVRELLPGSPFFESLGDPHLKGVFSLSFGGNNPTLFSIYRRINGGTGKGGRKEFSSGFRKIVSFPQIFEALIPKRFFPDEMKAGKGDGLVSSESSRFPQADEHFDFNVNHAEILFDDRVKRMALDFVNRAK